MNKRTKLAIIDRAIKAQSKTLKAHHSAFTCWALRKAEKGSTVQEDYADLMANSHGNLLATVVSDTAAELGMHRNDFRLLMLQMYRSYVEVTE